MLKVLELGKKGHDLLKEIPGTPQVRGLEVTRSRPTWGSGYPKLPQLPGPLCPNFGRYAP